MVTEAGAELEGPSGRCFFRDLLSVEYVLDRPTLFTEAQWLQA